MNKALKKITDLITSYSIYDWLRFIITILCNACAIYTVFYGLTHITDTASIAFLVTGILSFFTIYKLYEMMKNGGNDIYDARKNEESKTDARRQRP